MVVKRVGFQVISFHEQSYNDALYFYELGNKLDPNTERFQRRRFFTWAIIAADTCLEAYLNRIIMMKSTTRQVDEFLAKPHNFDDKLKIYLKQNLGIEIYNTDQKWEDIRNLIKLRNRILHHTNNEILKELNEQNAKKAIDSCREFIMRLDKASGITTSPWVGKTKSEVYDTNPLSNLS